MSNTGNDPLRGKFRRFLMYTVDNTVSNYLRKNRVREYPVGILKSQRVDFSSEGSRLRGFDFNWDELAQAYCNLPRSYQEVLFLLLVEELTPQEAAKSLHCTVQQIYVRKSRAIKNLRDQLGGNR